LPAQPERRPKVFWFGPPPKDELHEFKNRDLSLEINPPNPRVEFRFARSVVFRFNPQKPTRLFRDLKAHVVAAFDHGLEIMLVADDDIGQNAISEVQRKFPILNMVWRRTAPALSEIAEKAARYQPGPAEYPDLKINDDVKTGLSQEDRLLFRRAFWDCTQIVARSLDEGRSGNVFSVHATFRDSRVGPRPLPFFAKLDLKHKVMQEVENYRQFTEHFIPFSSRPNVDYSRCLVCSRNGIIVGNFVEHSESLWDLAVRGHANRAIHSLFDEALSGWHLQAYQQDSPPLTRNLYEALNGPSGEAVNIEKFTEERINTAFSMGATLNPEELIGLAKSLAPVRYRSAPIHGDLHAKNVRVRGSDAILIDFYLTRLGPIVADPASLESTLVFSAVDKKDKDESWIKTIDTLFEREYLENAPPPAKEPMPREWLWNCVRQIRQVALGMQMSKFEYAAVLGIYALRCAMFKPDYPEEQRRRAYAYVIAERLLKMVAKEYPR